MYVIGKFCDAIDSRQPIYGLNTTPIYSNTGFIILAYALENITGKPYKDMLQRSVIDPLHLYSTSVSKPDDSRARIWKQETPRRKQSPPLPIYPLTIPSVGGIYSSANDISTLGRSILNSTLLPINTTRAWLKPTAFTSSLYGAVGRPWEIYRAILAAESANRIVDIFTKAGDLGLYHSILALMPDYNVSYTVLAGGQESHSWVDGLMADIVLPALEIVAQEETDAIYAGLYETTNSLNSSTTFTTDAAKPGLGIQNWINNGTNMRIALSKQFKFPANTSSIRVYPTNLQRSTENGTGIIILITI
ncbi:beta-lactamase/transpeptidase-like protein [Zopfia rhizophila CBS 207.26]|uniref:Beta-lactamase/transpeptidase-like protein n=1 Tax=Zopfia rhizophila CBS 207.26 TaxID=1314779 RepID=A0A6A6D925_9PEZI|nr:beta-lactamase/transpeptidase-like protein [Zopfia rhizophila CBS 207.26]